ncbi:hypothetical protein DUI87_17212 [Hirundo rustica rustica]|uniref:Uncharacterized protein n=1 Tax=Hirundo rustica rustica TaxID=333673 RepID=A0A3M0K3H7_HIRRU|nr:hypothetical protein DUI87_17212 [Hirundo rustica rustica]
MKGLAAVYSSSKDESKQEVERSMLLRLEELLCVVEEVDPEDWCSLVKTGLKILLWGPAAVEHHKTCKSLGKSLWQQPSMEEILCLLDREKMMKTILSFPQHRRLLPSQVLLVQPIHGYPSSDMRKEP